MLRRQTTFFDFQFATSALTKGIIFYCWRIRFPSRNRQTETKVKMAEVFTATPPLSSPPPTQSVSLDN